ncbi:MAG: glycosyltransferase, partial [Henriciella sp.]|uniref:glycosyltransferase n=1 Tax=Henriciella sp. TaxID=1968823 RepID=UPI003C738A99
DDGPKYIDFLLNAEPLFIPQKEISAIVTSRLEKYRPETESWLAAHNVAYKELIMLDLPSAAERRRLRAHAPFKAEVYGARDDILFVESNFRQARDIAQLTDKPVIETASDTFFYGRADADDRANDAAGGAILANENHVMRNALQQAAVLLHENGFEPPAWTDSYLPKPSVKKPVNTPFRAARAVTAAAARRVDHLPVGPTKAGGRERRIAMIGTSFDIKRGAGAAASSARLRDELKLRGHTVRTFSTDDYPVAGTEASDQPVKGVHIPTWVTLGSTSISERITEDIDRFAPDCIIMGAIDRSVLSMPDLLDLRYPIVWIARDNWLHTGGCLFKLDDARISQLPTLPKSYATALTCTGYKSGCESCPSVIDQREAAKVSAAYMLKQMVLRRRPDIVFCGISPWMTEMLSRAPLTQDHRILTAYNPIPKPLAPDRPTCRSELGIADDQKVILLAVHKAENQRKGFALAAEALAKLAVQCDRPETISVAILGAVDAGALGKLNLPFKVIPVGFLTDEEHKSRLYKASDVCLVPSLQESLSVIASDSLRNGTPVVCFRTSGLADFVHHKANGYTALAYDTDDLAAGLHWTLFDADQHATRAASQAIAEKLFAPENAIPVYEGAIEEAIAQFDSLDPDQDDGAELALLLKSLGRDSRHRHVVRRHLEKELKKAKAS